MAEDTHGQQFKVGDVLRVSCPPAPTRVVHATPFDVTVEWPWAQIDPESELKWNGLRAIPRSEHTSEWNGLFQTTPDPRLLEVGSTCVVGVPETLVRIVDIGRYDPPIDVGWLPRPHTLLIVLPVDQPHHPDAEEEGDTIDLESAAPIEIELVARG
ncbi:hypothetical protein [Streptomyces sp. T028]|uniref:hypothetical protein n=1 Tax=Streptomyces sp. T028 TaxID=3394379 RepID=UPI003A8A899C